MRAKKWLVLFAAAVVLAVVVCGLFNVLVDPFGVFGDPIFHWYAYDMTNNPRAAKVAYLDENGAQYDSFVIGSSSAAAYNVEELNDYLDANFYNLFVYGCDTQVYCNFADYLLENFKVKNLVLNLGVNEANVYKTGNTDHTNYEHPHASGENALAFYLRYAFCNPQYSFDKLQARRKDTMLPQTFDVFTAESGCYDKRVRDVERIGDLAAYTAAHGGDFSSQASVSNLPYSEQCVQSVRYIKQRCDEAGVSLTVIFSPVYIGQWNQCAPDALRALKTEIAQITDYWDFSLSPISYDTRYFYDETHFRNAVGSMVLAEIFGNESVYRPENFGRHVTADNADAQLDALFSAQAADMADYTASVPILMYHALSEDDADGLSAAEFSAHLAALQAAGYTTVLPDELIGFVTRGEPLPEKPVLLTFDDGYLSNYELGYPALQQYGMRATIFVIGSSVGHTEHYKDTAFPITPHFSYEQALEMMRSGLVEVQCHTWDMHQWAPYETGDRIRENMAPFAGETDADFAAAIEADLEQAQSSMEAATGTRFTALAYPGGRHSTLTEVVVHAQGIPVTLTTMPGTNTLVRGLPQTLYALRRYTVTGDTTPEALLAMLDGE